jgi:hypothetical protein
MINTSFNLVSGVFLIKNRNLDNVKKVNNFHEILDLTSSFVLKKFNVFWYTESTERGPILCGDNDS